jgi:hypothetical protein
VKILWLPYLILTAASAWFIYAMIPSLIAIIDLPSKPDPQQLIPIMQPLLAPCAVMFVAALIFYPMQYAGLLRFLVRGEQPGGVFYLRFGGDEWNILVTYVVILLINIGIGLVFAAIDAGLRLGLPPASAQVSRQAIDFVMRILNLWISIKLSLAFAASIGIRGIGVGRSWSVVKGNWWNLLGFYLILGLIFLALLCALLAPFANQLWAMFSDLGKVGRDTEAFKALVRQHVLDLQTWMQHPGPIVYAIFAAQFVIGIVLLAIQVSAAGVAYRLITEGEGRDRADANASS